MSASRTDARSLEEHVARAIWRGHSGGVMWENILHPATNETYLRDARAAIAAVREREGAEKGALRDALTEARGWVQDEVDADHRHRGQDVLDRIDAALKGAAPMTAAKEPSVEEMSPMEQIVDNLEFCYAGRGSQQTYPIERQIIDLLISDWRRMGEELAEAPESYEVVLNSYAAENQQFFDRYEKAEAERDSARALLKDIRGWLERRGYSTARIAKELGPTREDEPRSSA